MGLLQFILATVLKSILFPCLYVVNSVIGLIKKEYFSYNHHLAFMLDIYGNHLGKWVFSWAFLNDKPFMKYGEGLKTISHVTARNYYNNGLNWFGLLFAKILILFKDKAFL